jgi:selenocysteine lyase/cysteine desulfurase
LLAKISRIAHESGALVLLGDYQNSATRPVNVKTMDLDFCVSGTVKYLLGPTRLALMYVRRALTLLLVLSNPRWVGQANPSALDVHC